MKDGFLRALKTRLAPFSGFILRFAIRGNVQSDHRSIASTKMVRETHKPGKKYAHLPSDKNTLWVAFRSLVSRAN